MKTRLIVLGEQRRQRELGDLDEEQIARLARETSRRARTFALFFGEADSKQTRPLEDPERNVPPRKRSKLQLGQELRRDNASAIAAAAC